MISKADQEHLIKWRESLPPNGRYDWNSMTRCLLANYLTAAGHGNVRVGQSRFYSHLQPDGRSIPWEVAEISQEKPHTYAAALKRAKQLFGH